jgi:hypothetical protein
MFYIIVFGSWGNCIVDVNGNPTWDMENVMTFKTRQDAGDYITAHWHEWAETMDCMRIYEKEACYE